MSKGAVKKISAVENGKQEDTVTLPRQLVQAMIDAIGRMPAGEVYPLLRALDEQLGLGAAPQPAPQPVQEQAPA
jgi:hypothetical protein